jgi:PAS domain S-box-containing protein/putative nucleotidyltransferase with HDIG domain
MIAGGASPQPGQALAELPVPPARASVSVLVVDDDPAQRLAFRAMLAPLHHAVVEADSGRAALEAVQRQTFAVILMDVRMPILDGYATAKRIREQTRPRVTPVIFATAFGLDEAETATAYASGAVDFIFTPILAEVLRAKVSAFVELYIQSQELQASVESITALNAALRDSELRARALVENVTDGIVTADEQGRIESLNRSALALFGYPAEEVLGQPLELVLARVHPAGASWARLAAEDGAAQTVETVGRRKDGSSFPVEMDVSQMQIGERVLTIECIRDISARVERAKREERRVQAMHRDAQRDRVAFDEAPIGSVITSRDGRVERVNEAICTMTGYASDELVGTQFSEHVHPGDRGLVAATVAALTTNGADTERGERRLLHRSGRILEVRVAVTAIRDDSQEVAQLFAQIEDVTEARRTSRELEQAQFEMLARLAAAAEYHDDSTGEHTRRVGNLSVAIARRLGLPDSDVELIRLAAPLHDLGKIAIPDAVLRKPGRLTAAEFEQMKTHTTVGAEMLAGNPFALLEMAEQIALTHHEKWDGSGYPAGLGGDEIPVAGRIVAVADVFDALTHVRPYKAAWTAAEAIAEMRSQRGRHFDPEILDAFLSVKAEDLGIRQ